MYYDIVFINDKPILQARTQGVLGVQTPPENRNTWEFYNYLLIQF
jgi:hypothetical protein